MTHVLPTLQEEIAPQTPRGESPEEMDAGFGALRTERGCLPVESLEVQARIDGLIARAIVTQTFVNVHAEPLEATYIFPLPDRAAVTSFRLEVAGRIVEGELKERGQARQEYQQAIRAGHRAALTEEDRPGVFTIQVGNLPPGESATVRLTLAGPLPYAAGEATFRFPLVVAPRYIPGSPLPGPSAGAGTSADTDAVPDASRISPPVLLRGFPNPVRLRLAVEISPSPLMPCNFRSSLHTVVEDHAGRAQVFRLQPGERLDRDFILRFRLGGEHIQPALLLQPDAGGQGGTFLLTLMPPVLSDAVRPRDVVFVLDRSGSMAGWKMVAARRALARMVDTLTERDRFAVLAFDNSIETPPELGQHLIAATNRNRFRAVEFLAKVEARGGTEMAEPLLQAAEELADASGGRDRVVVLVTDGQIGNEDQILRDLGRRIRGVRIFALGIDQAVNAAFLRRLADLGGAGGCELVESEDRLDEVMDVVHRRIATPVLTALRLEAAGLQIEPDSIVPGRMPDLFADVPLLLMGRYRGLSEGGVVFKGRSVDGAALHERIDGRVVADSAAASIWARGRVRELEDGYIIATGDRTTLEKAIIDTSLRFGVLCRFTAYVAVDRSEVVNAGGRVHSVVQPVEQPSGWENVNACMAVGMPQCAPVAASPRGLGAMPSKAAPDRLRRSAKKDESPAADGEFGLTLDDAGSSHFEQQSDGSEAEVFETDFDVPGRSQDSFSDALALEESGTNLESSDFDPALEPVAARKPRGRWLQRLLGLFFGGSDKEKSRPAIDRTPFSQRAADLLRQVQVVLSGDRAARLAAFEPLVDALEQFFEDITAAGDRDASVARLGEALVEARSLLEEAAPGELAVHRVCERLDAALKDWLALLPGPTPSRAGFWKSS
jgi:Ca-activated chloride channel family protein